jgi:GNAT superfamily N-acetyltransferase
VDDALFIRLAGPDDAEALFPLIAAFYAEEGYAFDLGRSCAALADLLARPPLGHVLVLAEGERHALLSHRPPDDEEGPGSRKRDEGRFLGYLVLTFGFSLEFGGRDAFVDELYVVPSRRAQGLGRALLARAEAEALRAGVAALHLEVETSKPRTHDFYRRLGFQDHQRHLLTKRL